MIEFYGVLSDKCNIEMAKKVAKNAGVFFSIVTLILGIPLIIYGTINNKLFYALILLTVFVAISIIAFIPSKRMLHYKIPVRLIIENETIARTSIGGSKSLTAKPISKVKKVVDAGEWYYLIFSFGDISNSWVCQKNLMIQGTIDDFEALFKGKIVTQV